MPTFGQDFTRDGKKLRLFVTHWHLALDFKCKLYHHHPLYICLHKQHINFCILIALYFEFDHLLYTMLQTLSNVDHGETLYNEKDKIKLRVLKVLCCKIIQVSERQKWSRRDCAQQQQQQRAEKGWEGLARPALRRPAHSPLLCRSTIVHSRYSADPQSYILSAPQIYNCTFSLLCRSTIVHSLCSADLQLYILSALQIYNRTFSLL